MIPSYVSWKYTRTDTVNCETHGIACKLEIAIEDIYLRKILPNDIDDFVLFVFIITKQDDKNVIITALKTNNNTGDEERILKGSYFACYLLPVNIIICSFDLVIYDMFKEDLFYKIDIKNIFNKNYLNTITFPGNTFTF